MRGVMEVSEAGCPRTFAGTSLASWSKPLSMFAGIPSGVGPELQLPQAHFVSNSQHAGIVKSCNSSVCPGGVCIGVGLAAQLRGQETFVPPRDFQNKSRLRKLRTRHPAWIQALRVSNSVSCHSEGLSADKPVLIPNVESDPPFKPLPWSTPPSKPTDTRKPQGQTAPATRPYGNAKPPPLKTDIVQELRGVALHRKNAPPLSNRIGEVLTRYRNQSSKAWAQSLRKIGILPSKGPEIAYIVLAWIAENVQGGITAAQCGNVLVGASRAGNAEVIERVFELMERCNINRTIQQYNMLLSAYIRASRPEDAFTLFRQLSSANKPQPSIVTFNTLISACGSVSRGAARVCALMSAMTSAGVAADVITYNAALKVVGAKGLVREAEALLTEMTSQGVRPTEVTYLTLIDMYGRVPGGLPRAEEIYRQMLQDPIVRPETPQLSAMMSAYARAGDWEGTERVFEDLVSRGLKPDHMVYVARLTAHGNTRRTPSVRAVFAEMQSAGLTPNFITWTAFVDALARCGESPAAEKALQDMTSSGIPPTARSFTVLFDAYVTSGQSAEGAGLLTRMVKEFRCKPNVGIYTVQIGHLCHVSAYEDAAKIFREMLRVGIRPELHTYVTLMSAVCTCLQSVGATSADARTLLDAIGSCDEPLYRATLSLLNPSSTHDESQISGLVNRVDGLTYQQQCDFFSQLIGALWFAGLRERAARVFRAAHFGGVYSGAFSTRGEEWSVDMHRVSPGVAQLMLVLWLRELRETLETAREGNSRAESAEENNRLIDFDAEQRKGGRLAVPRLVKAITGWGKHSAGEGEAVVGKAVGDLVEEVGAPFRPLRLGSYSATGEDLNAWFDQPGTAGKLLLRDA